LSESGTPDINRIKQSAEFQRLADRLWDKWEGRRVTLDSRGRPNRLVFTNFLARAIRIAYEAGVPDPYKDIDWETIIDPDLNQAENLSVIEQRLGARAGRRPRAPGETEEGMLRSQIEGLEREIEELNFEIEFGETTGGERLTPEQVESARRRRAELEAQLEELRRRLERLERGRITAWLPREALPPALSARPAERRASRPPERGAPRPAPQPTPLTAFQPAPSATPPPAPQPQPVPAPPAAPTPEEERKRLWEAFSIVLAAAGIDPTEHREDFEAEYRLVADRPYEEKFSDIMRFASDIVRTYRPRPAPAAPPELQQVLQGLRDTLDRLSNALSARPPTPQELLLAMGSELATVQPDRAVIQTYVREHNCWAWVPNRYAEGLMRRYGLHNLIISRFFDCVEYWPSYPGACLWGAELVDDMVEKGLITDPFATWLRALAAEIDRRYREEGRAPCR